MQSFGVPRRFTQYAKDLQRAGMNIVPEPRKGEQGYDPMSDKAVEKVTTAAEKLDGLGDKAERVANHLDATIAEVDETLNIAQDMSSSLRRVGANLRARLGVQTNRPPTAEALPETDANQ